MRCIVSSASPIVRLGQPKEPIRRRLYVEWRGIKSGTAQAQYRQIDIWIILGKIGFEWFSAHAEGFLKAVGRKPSGVGSSVVFHARTLRKLLDILTHRAACAAPLSFADY